MPESFSLPFFAIGCETFAIFSSTTEGVSADFLSLMCQIMKLEIPCAENSNLVITGLLNPVGICVSFDRIFYFPCREKSFL